MTLSIEANCFSSIPSGETLEFPENKRQGRLSINMPNMELDKLILKLWEMTESRIAETILEKNGGDGYCLSR